MSDIKKTTKKLLVTSALSLALIGASQVMFEDVQAAGEVEKCYGIAKAGQNDCASTDGSHNCSGQSVKDAQAGDWIALPQGICDRIVGGTTVAKTSASTGDATTTTTAPAAK